MLSPLLYSFLFLNLLLLASLFAQSKIIAVLPFDNLHKKPHLEFVKNIVHEELFTQLANNHMKVGSNSPSITTSSSPISDYIIIGVSSLEDAKKLYEISKGRVPSIVLQGEYFMIRDRMALNVSLLNPKDGSRIDGTGELVVYKGHRHPELQGNANFQQSLYEDMKEPLNKLLVGIRVLIEGKNDGKE